MPVKYIIFYWNDALVYTRISEQGNNHLFNACRTCLIDPLLESLPRLSPLATMLKWRALCSGQAVGRGLDTCLELANQIL